MSLPVVAVYGVHGALGKHVLNALTSDSFYSKLTGPVHVISRNPDSDNQQKRLYWHKAKSISEADAVLGKADVLIDLTGPRANLNDTIESLRRTKHVKLYIPSQFGSEVDKLGDLTAPAFLAKIEHSQRVRALGLKVIDIFTGIFDDPDTFLGEWIQVVGANPDGTEVAYIGNPNTKFSTSKLPDIGKVVAAVVTSTKFEELPDKVRVFSNLVTPEDVVRRWEAKHGKTLERKPVIPLDDAYAKALYLLKTDPSSWPTILNILKYTVAAGKGKGLQFEENERELVNPKEILFSWTPFDK